MFLDFKTIKHDAVIQSDLCIIGAGAAGITIARELIGKSHRVCLVESGGLEYEPMTQSLADGESIGLPYYPSHWVIMSSADDFLSYLRDQKWSESLTSPSIRSWSDHYSNILSVIGNKTIEKRIEILKEEKRARDKMQQEVH